MKSADASSESEVRRLVTRQVVLAFKGRSGRAMLAQGNPVLSVVRDLVRQARSGSASGS